MKLGWNGPIPKDRDETTAHIRDCATADMTSLIPAGFPANPLVAICQRIVELEERLEKLEEA